MMRLIERRSRFFPPAVKLAPGTVLFVTRLQQSSRCSERSKLSSGMEEGEVHADCRTFGLPPDALESALAPTSCIRLTLNSIHTREVFPLADFPPVPLTLEGSALLHQFFRFDWKAWRCCAGRRTFDRWSPSLSALEERAGAREDRMGGSAMPNGSVLATGAQGRPDPRSLSRLLRSAEPGGTGPRADGVLRLSDPDALLRFGRRTGACTSRAARPTKRHRPRDSTPHAGVECGDCGFAASAARKP